VGHTGVYDAAVVAITETDKAVGTVYKAAEEAGYILLITADHGNAEQMKDPVTGNPHTAHTTNAVPFIMTGNPDILKFAEEKVETEKKEEDEEEGGALCDVAPTILAILGLEQPKGVLFNSLQHSSVVDGQFHLEMSGRSLLAKE
jgi:2,3-bisphosphoglycerate-independent phosphoglycerate mutase